MDQFFLPNSMMFLLICLDQSIAAQRLFGGTERPIAWREAKVSSLSQVMFGFVGKDLSSLVEMLFAATCCSLPFWPDAGTFASWGDLLAITFACIYCVWGLNHTWTIAFPAHTAMLFAVVSAFMAFLFNGVI